MKKTFTLFLCFICFCSLVSAQKAEKEKREYKLNLSAGAVRHIVKDLSLSPNVYNGINPRFTAGYEAQKSNTCGGLLFHAQFGNIGFKRPNYSNRKWQVLKFGADAVKMWKVHTKNNTTFYTGPIFSILINGRIPHVSDNNFTGYEIANSLGISGKINRNFNIKNRELILSNQLNLPLFSHLIRPAYTGPYPIGFLQDGVFNTNGEVTPKSVLKSGKLVTLNRYINLDNYLFLTYKLKKNQNAFRLTYNWQFYKAGLHEKTVWAANHSLFFSLLMQI